MQLGRISKTTLNKMSQSQKTIHCVVSFQFSSVAQSCPILCNPINLSTPGLPVHPPWVHPNPYPLSRWCHPTISSSVVPFSSCPQSFRASGSFQMSQFFAIRWPKNWSFSFIISPSNEYSGLISYRIDWFDLLAVHRFSRVFSSTTVWKHKFFGIQPSLYSSSHIPTWLLGKL